MYMFSITVPISIESGIMQKQLATLEYLYITEHSLFYCKYKVAHNFTIQKWPLKPFWDVIDIDAFYHRSNFHWVRHSAEVDNYIRIPCLP